MIGSLDRRLTALERAPAARQVVLRVYSTPAEAAADTELPPLGATVLQLITGVPRSPAREAATP